MSFVASPRSDRRALRQRMHGVRDRFAAECDASAEPELARRLIAVLDELQPECLGLYWPLRSEFNAAATCHGHARLADIALALPFASKSRCEMTYHAWDGNAPSRIDECGIPAPDGARVVPDVVLVPCLGFTRSGFRLGYGGGFFDRWLAAHPHATAVGIAWSACEIDEADLAPQPHDLPLMVIVTEREVIGG